MQSPRTYTVIILGNDHKKFALYTDPLVGHNLQTLLTQKTNPRPYTHDLIQMIFQGFDIRLKQVVINRIEDTIYFSRLFVEQQLDDRKQILEIDSRPSDSLTLALIHNAPIYCNKEVFDQTVPIEE